MIINSACPECGMIPKSGKASCCGRGGSWFGSCGSAGNAHLGHTWHEGIQVCKGRQFQAVAGQQLHAPHPKVDTSSDDVSMGMQPKAVVVGAHIDMFVSATASTFATATGTSLMTVRFDT